MPEVRFPNVPSYLPPGQKGNAVIEHFTVTQEDAAKTRRRFVATRSMGEWPVEAGTYARLLLDGEVMMSDTPMERATNREVVEQARGRVLIAGLGIGLILKPILRKKQVRHVTVVELSQDVIDLVGPHFMDRKLDIVQGDIFTWIGPRIGTKSVDRSAAFDTIYFDIWPDINQANLRQMTQLRRLYKPRLADNGWMGCWTETYLLTGRPG